MGHYFSTKGHTSNLLTYSFFFTDVLAPLLILFVHLLGVFSYRCGEACGVWGAEKWAPEPLHKGEEKLKCLKQGLFALSALQWLFLSVA